MSDTPKITHYRIVLPGSGHHRVACGIRGRETTAPDDVTCPACRDAAGLGVRTFRWACAACGISSWVVEGLAAVCPNCRKDVSTKENKQ